LISPAFADTCSFFLSSPGQSFTSAGGPGSVNVATSPTFGCAWGAASNANWITNVVVSQPYDASSAGSVSYTVQANSGPDRSGTLTTAGLPYPVTKSGANTPAGSNVLVQAGDIAVVSATVTPAGPPRVQPSPPPIVPPNPIVPPSPIFPPGF